MVPTQSSRLLWAQRCAPLRACIYNIQCASTYISKKKKRVFIVSSFPFKFKKTIDSSSASARSEGVKKSRAHTRLLRHSPSPPTIKSLAPRWNHVYYIYMYTHTHTHTHTRVWWYIYMTPARKNPEGSGVVVGLFVFFPQKGHCNMTNVVERNKDPALQ